MSELAKWAWIILLIILFLGPYAFIIFGFNLVALILVAWLKPEWLKRKY